MPPLRGPRPPTENPGSATVEGNNLTITWQYPTASNFNSAEFSLSHLVPLISTPKQIVHVLVNDLFA